MRRTVCLGLLMGLGVCVWSAQAQGLDGVVKKPSGSLDIQSAQRETLEHSPAYRKALANEKETSWGRAEALSEGFLPHVSVEGTYYLNNRYAKEGMSLTPNVPSEAYVENFPDANVTLDAELILFDGLRNVNRLRAAKDQHKAARLLSRWTAFKLQQEVRLAFYKALAARKLSEMADENVKALQDHLRIVDDLMQNGQATKYDVLRVEVQLSEAKSDQISYHDNVILSRERLAQAMGLPMDERPLQGELPVVNPATVLGKASQGDFAERSDLKAGDLQAQAAGKQSAAAAAFWVPQVSLIGEVQWYDRQDTSTVDPNNIINTGRFDNSYYVGASVKWDLFDGGVSWAKSKEAHAKADAAKAARDEERIKAPYDFDLWRRALISKASLYEARLTDIDKEKERVRLATLGFKAGTRTTTDVLDAELEVFKATSGMVQAQVDALEALINLEIALGGKQR